ncbi:MAG: lipase [Ruminococcaceae bacterium]|nr:lipase [Oscillospiraceae bacterium]
MRILCYGDSNTYGFDPRSFSGSRYSSPWPELLAKSGWEVTNHGMNGRTIPTAACLPPPRSDADILVVMLGSNDLLQGCSAPETAARMEAFLSQMYRLWRHILLVAPPPMQRGQWVTQVHLLSASAALPALYQDLAQRLGISFADAGAWGVELGFDGVHFTENGHRAFAQGLHTALQSMTEAI